MTIYYRFVIIIYDFTAPSLNKRILIVTIDCFDEIFILVICSSSRCNICFGCILFIRCSHDIKSLLPCFVSWTDIQKETIICRIHKYRLQISRYSGITFFLMSYSEKLLSIKGRHLNNCSLFNILPAVF